MIRRSLALIMVLSAAACSYSESQVRVPDDHPAILVANAPDDALLLVDGRTYGPVTQFFHDDQVLRLEPGTHKIVVTLNGQALLTEKVFLGGGEIRTLTVPGGAK